MSVAAEPPRPDGGAGPRRAVLLCNLGTPDAPTAAALRRYLAQFLSDPRVVEIPAWAWQPVLHGIVLRLRPRRSAEKYARIWTEAGSPLRVWTEKQARLLGGYLGEREQRALVRHAMRYGEPSIGRVLDDLAAQGATRILVLPLYPQYSAATTASSFDAVHAWAARRRVLPELRLVNGYHDHPLYIRALEQRVREHWRREGPADRLVLSFHGMPERTRRLGDPYHAQCLATARLLGERLQLPDERLRVSFQSRFGRARWLEPSTEATLRALAAQGVDRVEVMCPGFAADCLETLEEIAIEARHGFLEAGGREFHYIECLNDHHAWIDALAAIAIEHLHGWGEAATPVVPSSRAVSSLA